MGETDPVTQLKRPLPRSITLVASSAEGLTPNEMRSLKEASGRRLDDLFGDAADLDDKTQALVWIQLRRQGFAPTWDEAGDVMPIGTEAEAPDPTNADSSNPSPPSVGSGA